MQDGGLLHLESSISCYVIAFLNVGLPSLFCENYTQNLDDYLYSLSGVSKATFSFHGDRAESGPSLCLQKPYPSYSLPLDSNLMAFFMHWLRAMITNSFAHLPPSLYCGLQEFFRQHKDVLEPSGAALA